MLPSATKLQPMRTRKHELCHFVHNFSAGPECDYPSLPVAISSYFQMFINVTWTTSEITQSLVFGIDISLRHYIVEERKDHFLKKAISRLLQLMLL
ncbi:hypothetical protein LINPERHAP2_LOCUS7994 [Linum perenne]